MRSEKTGIEKSFQISGIDCPLCAEEVKKELLKLDEIISANIDVDESQLSLKLKSPEANKNIERTISELGLQIQKEGSKKTSVFLVEEMDCSNEEKIIRENLSKIQGIEELNFDLINHRLIVTHSITEGKIIKALKSLGFKAQLYHNRLHLRSTSQTKNKIGIYTLLFALILILIGFTLEYLGANNSIALVLFALAILSGGYRVLYKGFLSLKKFIIDINVLMSIAVLGAVLIGKFSEAALVMLLYSLSLKIESFSLEKARHSINKLISLIPEYSTIKKGDEFIEISTNEVSVGDIVLIRPGEKIPVDGIVIQGSSAINQSTITGESKLIAKVPGDICYAGTINQRGTLLIEATSTFKNSQFSKILSLLDKTTKDSKSNLERVVDVFSKYYTPIIVLLAFVFFLYSFLVLNKSFDSSIYTGLVLLVISCPCALVISTPVAILSALARSTKLGALIKGGIILENLHRIEAIAFDKTGTLTEGNLSIDKIISLTNMTEEEILQIAFSLEIHSEHSIADAIINYGKTLNLKPEEVVDFKLEEGSIFGKINGKTYKIGQPKLFFNLIDSKIKDQILELEQTGNTVILILESQNPIGLISFTDSLRESMKSTIEELRNVGIKEFFILSGDNANIVKKTAEYLNIENYYPELKPADKLKLVEDLNKRFKYFAMVGDGLNDAPALKSATIGIAMGKIGVDATIENSDMTLIGDDISKLPKILRLSHKAVKTIKENIFLSIAIKLCFIIFSIIEIATMWGAIFADMGTSLIVIFNSLKLIKTKI